MSGKSKVDRDIGVCGVSECEGGAVARVPVGVSYSDDMRDGYSLYDTYPDWNEDIEFRSVGWGVKVAVCEEHLGRWESAEAEVARCGELREQRRQRARARVEEARAALEAAESVYRAIG